MKKMNYKTRKLVPNWGGKFVHFGKNIYANFGLTLVDDTHIYVGDNTEFGPNVVVATAGHPIDPERRREGLQYNSRYISAKTAGSARARSSCPASRLVITPSSARAAW